MHGKILLTIGCVALMLYRFRAGDANTRSVWICSRNDAIGNMAVLLAAMGVFGTGTGWLGSGMSLTSSGWRPAFQQICGRSWPCA